MQAKTLTALVVSVVATLGAALVWSAGQAGRAEARFATWESLELDAHASVWLIERYVAPGTRVEFRRSGAAIDDRTAIAIPGTSLGRGAGLSAFEKLVAHYGVSDERVLRLGRIVNNIEVSAWSSVADPQAGTVEQTYRWLQARYAHEVPADCYRAFFDVLNEQLDAADLSLLPIKAAHLSQNFSGCPRPVAAPPTQPPVRLLPVADILAYLAAGERVVFVDVREASEFDERHIPGSINLTLREIDAGTVERLRDADLVVPYCIKDFRGYEAARKLARLGLHTVGTMDPHGLAGWQALGLPVATADLPDSQALSALRQRAETG